jgi:hypothetical protein
VARDVTVLGRYRMAALAGAQAGRRSDGAFAMAIRPHTTDRGALLFSYDFAKFEPGSGSTGVSDSLSDRMSIDGLLLLPAGFEVYGRGSVTRQPGPVPESRQRGTLFQGRLQRLLFNRLDLAGELRRITESVHDPGRTVYAAELGVRLAPDLRLGLGLSSGAFAMPGSVLQTTASRGGAYLVLSSTLARLFDLMPGSSRAPTTASGAR